MPIVGDVIRIGGSSLTYSNDASNVGGAGGAAYSAFRADGQRVGMFQTAGAAQRALQLSLGNIPIVWTRADLEGDIERYQGRGGNLDLREIWAGDLLLWNQTGIGVSASSTGLVRRWSDRSGNGHNLLQATALNQLSLSEEYSLFKGRDALLLSSAGPAYMDFSDLALGVEPPFTVMLVANATTATGTLLSSIAGGTFSIGIDASRQWVVANGATITGPVASTTRADIVTVTQTATACIVRVNGTQVGTNALAPAAFTPRLSTAVAGTAFDGSITSLMIASQVDGSLTKVLQAERYLTSLYVM